MISGVKVKKCRIFICNRDKQQEKKYGNLSYNVCINNTARVVD